MADELIDIYDSEMNLLGVAPKSQAHKEGLWHKLALCWIISEDGNLWLQKRSPEKQTCPNLFDCSGSGHVLVGEAPKEAVRRILEDKLGLSVKEKFLDKLFTYKLVNDTPTANTHAFCPTYLLKTQQKLHNLKLNPDEVSGIYEADIQDLLDLFFDEVKKINVRGIVLGKKCYKIEKRTLSKDDFCPHGDKYFQKVFSAIQRFIDNQ